MSADLRPLIIAAVDRPLTAEETGRAFGLMLDGEASPVQVAALLVALRTRGETPEEIAGAVGELRARMVRVRAPEAAIDIVGTGGDGRGTLNISTAAAFVVAGAGIPVAKHGNRNVSSLSGAADVLGHLGIEVMVGAPQVERALAEAGIGFMMAPMHHPAMRHVGPVRAELGLRSIFNVVGPLSNPADVTRQLTGAYAPHLLRPMAEVLARLGSEAAWLVHGSDGTDEITIAGPTAVVELRHGVLSEREVHPEEAGLPVHPFEAILGGGPAGNAAAMRALLGGARGAYRDAVLLNAAAALLVAGGAASLRDGAERARESIDSGAALRALDALARVSQDALARASQGAPAPA